MATATPVAAIGDISLQGWDTANAVTFDTLNAAITKQGSTPKTFAATNKFSGSIAGQWGAWQLLADPSISGGTLKMACPVVSGNATDVLGGTYDLAGACAYITVELEAVADTVTKVADKTADPTKPGAVTSLMPKSTAGTGGTPPVSVLVLTPAALDQPFKSLFDQWFVDHIADFNQVFFTAVLNEKADVDDFQWLKPTFLGYANVTDASGDAVFAALCQTDNDGTSKLAYQIDAGLASDFPGKTNAVFAISAEKFAEKFLKRGACAVFEGSKDTDFDITGNDLIVTNNKDLLWRNVELEDKSRVDLMVPARSFSLYALEDRIILDFTDAHFTHALLIGTDTISLSFKQSVFLKVGTNASGGTVLVTTNKDPSDPNATEAPVLRECSVTVTPDQTAVEGQRILEIIGMVASVLSLGSFAAGKWAVSAAEYASSAAQVRTAITAADTAINVAMDGANVASDAATVGEGNLAAAAAMSAGGPPLLANYVTFLSRFGMATGVFAATAGILGGGTAYQLLKDGEIKTDNIPSLDGFIDHALGASQWPHVKGFDLKDVRLRKTLLLYGMLST